MSIINLRLKLSYNVFDHTVKPVLLYGSEVWGIFVADKLQKQKDLYLNKLCTDFTAEKIHIKLCKYLLEVGRRLTNSAVLGELGRFPLILEACLNIVKYWAYLSNLSNKDSLVAEAHLTSKIYMNKIKIVGLNVEVKFLITLVLTE